MNNFFLMKMQITVHLVLTNYQCTNMQIKNAITTRKFLTKNLQIDMAINAISVISTNNKLVFILIFVIDNTSIYKTYVVKSSFSTKKKKVVKSILYLISLIQLRE